MTGDADIKAARREYLRGYYARNRDRLLFLQRLRQSVGRDEWLAYHRAWKRLDRQRHPEYYLWAAAKRRARAKGLPFTLRVSGIRIPALCPVLGIPLAVNNLGRAADNSATLDRIDNRRGYTVRNTRVISYRANMLKKDMTRAEARLIFENWNAR